MAMVLEWNDSIRDSFANQMTPEIHKILQGMSISDDHLRIGIAFYDRLEADLRKADSAGAGWIMTHIYSEQYRLRTYAFHRKWTGTDFRKGAEPPLPHVKAPVYPSGERVAAGQQEHSTVLQAVGIPVEGDGSEHGEIMREVLGH